MTRLHAITPVGAIACVMLVAASAMAAQADPGDRLAACLKEADDAVRLACYDRAMGRSAAHADPAAGAKPPPPPAAAAAAPAAAAATATAAASEAAVASGAASTDTFGVSGSEVARKRGAEQQSSAAKVDRMNAKVTAISKRTRGELVITLDNGQVWAQKDPQYMPVKAGDEVTILAGAFNSYRLIFENRATPVTRVQ